MMWGKPLTTIALDVFGCLDRKHEGTGLELPLNKMVMEQLGGA